MRHLGFTRKGNCRGRPLVLLHGWGCDSRFLLPIADMFPERDVFLVDLPGYGQSKELIHYAQNPVLISLLLLNTIPDQSDLIAWSCGTLYALRALSLNERLLQAGQYHISLPPEYRSHGKYHAPALWQAGLCEDLRQIATCLDQYSTTLLAPDDWHEQLCSIFAPAHDHCPWQQLNLPHVRSLITICGTPFFPSSPNWPGLAPSRIDKIRHVLDANRLQQVLTMFYQMQFSLHPEYFDDLQLFGEFQDDIDADILLKGMQQIAYMDERNTLKHLHQPSLHLFGAYDLLVPSEQSQVHFNSQLHRSYTFPFSAHAPFLTEPESFKQQVADFFSQLDQATAAQYA